MGNSFSGHSWLPASRKTHLASLNRMAFIRKQNPFVYFAVKKQTCTFLAVTEFVYVLSEPYRPKKLSGAILALTLPAPGTGVPG